MNKTNGPINRTEPWRLSVAVAQIPETGLHRELEADRAAREAMADIAGLREILSANAWFDVTPKSGGRFHVAGRVQARIGQICVVTLDPVENDIDEAIDLTFAPPEQIPQLAALADEAAEIGDETPDPPDPLENGAIDLGRLATDVLFLAIDPYPRKPDAVFAPVVAAADPEDHPFAALRVLQIDANPPNRNKPGGKR